MTPDISICTGTRHRPASLKRLVDSIFATATLPTEVIIADASDSFAAAMADSIVNTSECCRVLHYHESPRLGFVKGYNAAFRRAHGRYVVFVNDDAEFLPGWDRIAVGFMDRNVEVGQGALYWSDPGACPYVQELQGMVYANFGVMRREVGEAIGWIDDAPVFVPEMGCEKSLEFYGSDCNLSWQFMNAGYAVCAIPGTRIRHYRENDGEREHNNQKYIHGEPSRLPGRLLWLKWNGDHDKQAALGFEYGYRQLREKYAAFKRLHAPITQPLKPGEAW